MSQFIEALKSNWYLAAAFVVLVAAGLFYAFRPAPEEEAAPVDTPAPTGTPQAAEVEGPFQSITPTDEATGDVEEYQRLIAENPNGEETPRHIERMANLYMSSLRDYEKAIYHYEDLLHRFPKYKLNEYVYPRLAQCYHQIQDFEKERWTFERMLQAYPEGSDANNLARQSLGMEMVERVIEPEEIFEEGEPAPTTDTSP